MPSFSRRRATSCVYRPGGATRRARVKAIINAGGAWIDKINARLGIETAYMGGSKGSHLVVENPALHAALKGRMVYFGTADGRVNLVYPLLGRVLIGSTDIPVGDPDSARCDDDEAAYLRARRGRGLSRHPGNRGSGRLPLLRRAPAPADRRGRDRQRHARPLDRDDIAAWLWHPGPLPDRRQVDHVPGLFRASRRPRPLQTSASRARSLQSAWRSAEAATSRATPRRALQ